MFSVVCTAFSAASYGTADFCGGKATRRANPLFTVFFSQVASMPLLIIGLLVIGAAAPTGTSLMWSVAAGVLGFVGTALLYRGLANSAISVFAPITAVVAAMVPAVVGLALGESPGTLARCGVAVAIVAIGLVSAGPVDTAQKISMKVVGSAFSAGLFIGGFFVCMAQSGSHAGLWPIAGARLGSLILGALVLTKTRQWRGQDGVTWRWIVSAGILDMTASVSYLVAAGQGMVSVVAPIASLAPTFTVVLAFALERERIALLQLTGIGLAAAALALVAV